MLPSEWSEARNFYNKDDLEDFTRDVRRSSLSKARPPRATKIPAEAERLLFHRGPNAGQSKDETHNPGSNGKQSLILDMMPLSIGHTLTLLYNQCHPANGVLEELASLRVAVAESQPRVKPKEGVTAVSDRQQYAMMYHEAVLRFERQSLVDKVMTRGHLSNTEV